jgi:hypothetical protein
MGILMWYTVGGQLLEVPSIDTQYRIGCHELVFRTDRTDALLSLRKAASWNRSCNCAGQDCKEPEKGR